MLAYFWSVFFLVSRDGTKLSSSSCPIGLVLSLSPLSLSACDWDLDLVRDLDAA